MGRMSSSGWGDPRPFRGLRGEAFSPEDEISGHETVASENHMAAALPESPDEFLDLGNYLFGFYVNCAMPLGIDVVFDHVND